MCDTGDNMLCVLTFIILLLLKALFSKATVLDPTIPFLCWDILLIFSLKKTNYFYTNCSIVFLRVSPVKNNALQKSICSAQFFFPNIANKVVLYFFYWTCYLSYSIWIFVIVISLFRKDGLVFKEYMYISMITCGLVMRWLCF